MDASENLDIDQLAGEFAGFATEADAARPEETAAPAPRRDITRMMRKIPVTLTLEVGAARISLQELLDIREDSVLELDTLAGEPLLIRVNGSPIGRAEVVVSGENYGLKVVELHDLDLGHLAP